jgi:hypothetical protein
MAVANGELYQVTISGIYLGQTIQNVLMFRARTPTTTNADIATALRSFWHTIRSVYAFDFQLIFMIVKRVTPIALDSQFVTATAGEEHGGASASGLTSTVAALLTLRTGTAGKTHRGRIYVAPVDAAMCAPDLSQLSAAGLTQFVTTAQNIMNEFDDATGTSGALALGIYSRLIGGTAPMTVAGWQAVNQIVPQPILGNQRRRRIGRGA